MTVGVGPFSIRVPGEIQFPSKYDRSSAVRRRSAPPRLFSNRSGVGILFGSSSAKHRVKAPVHQRCRVEKLETECKSRSFCAAVVTGDMSVCRFVEPQRTRHETLLVFDWDDTLFPSSWIRRFGVNPWNIDSFMTSDSRRLLDSVSETAERVVRKATTLGRVVVISNAHSRWLQHSLKQYSPRLNSAFNQLDIPVLSARNTKGLNTPLAWKFACMYEAIAGIQPCTQVLSAVDLHAEALSKGDLPRFGNIGEAVTMAKTSKLEDMPNLPRNVIGFGDQPHDRLAFLMATQLRSQLTDSALKPCIAKSIKFIESPNIYDLRRQLEHVVHEIGGLVSSASDLDLRFSIDKQQRA